MYSSFQCFCTSQEFIFWLSWYAMPAPSIEGLALLYTHLHWCWQITADCHAIRGVLSKHSALI